MIRIDIQEKADVSGVARAAADAAVQAALRQTAEVIAETARRAVLDPPKTGRIYHGHQASAPGEAPATDTGVLAASIHSEQSGLEAQAYVDNSASYGARYLEHGSPSGKIAPRPFLTPAAEAHRDDLARQIAAELAKALRG